MQTYSQFQPTGLDARGLGLDDRQDWLVAPVTTNRDADCLTRSNWAVVCADIRKAAEGDPEDSCEEHIFGHWACGHFEIMLVRPGSKAAECAEEWEAALADYPVASDDHFSDLEFQECADYWSNMSIRERRQYCERARVSRFAAYQPFGKIPDALYERIRDA